MKEQGMGASPIPFILNTGLVKPNLNEIMDNHTITPDDVLNDDENKRLSEMLAIKKHVYAFLNKEKLAEFILFVIDSSEVVKFERKSDRRFLNMNNLSMSLVLDIEKATAKYNQDGLYEAQSPIGRETAMSARASLLREILVVPFTDMMSNILGTIIDREPGKDYIHRDWITQILPEDYKDLRRSVSNFVALSKSEKEEMKDNFKFMFGMASAFVFPPEDVNLNEDTGFTLEFLL